MVEKQHNRAFLDLTLFQNDYQAGPSLPANPFVAREPGSQEGGFITMA
jgi:hypothetical protein